jgi:hypothetical protein
MYGQAAPLSISIGNGVMNGLMVEIVIPLILMADQGTNDVGRNLYHRPYQVDKNRIAGRLHQAGMEFGVNGIDVGRLLPRDDRLLVPLQAFPDTLSISGSCVHSGDSGSALLQEITSLQELLMGVVPSPKQEIEQLDKSKSAVLGDDGADTMPNVHEALCRQNAHGVAHDRSRQAKLLRHFALGRKGLTNLPVSGDDQLLQAIGQFLMQVVPFELNDRLCHHRPLPSSTAVNQMGERSRPL